ncbi:ABC transporter permease [Limosilactobacillus sp. STM2_1]|uniref:ABC transporter permease n=1 Tax=Limosilactobacillus rudii TaxID=2759755 RepID=A0A7W3UJG9_9LACO|nr:ABC transporter permease [Limosilactobacillus rudii]MBB1078509.1 ABC transporter permease [Limosilactobacillus rudii]MBB1096639.1 ABC transporter permease [Limosilactobacillus rudii]MCD7134165.1 ABC transporter permease [Limosilactobacillus rudii]
MRTLAITKRTLIELLRDKRALALMFLAPILILWLMNVMFSANSDPKVEIATVNVSQTIQQNLKKVDGVSVKAVNSNRQAKNKLKKNKVDAIINYNQAKNHFNVTYANTDSTKTTLTKQALKAAITGQTITTLSTGIQRLQSMVKSTNPNISITQENTKAPSISNHYQYGNADTSFFTKIVPILMGFFVFFFVFLISGMALLKERTSGTFDRLLATPVRRSEIVFGYMLSYGIISILQSTVIVLTTVWLLKIEVVGSIINIIIISVLLAFVALAFGILMSTLANSEFQMMQFIPLVVVPQIFFSGIIPLDSMASWVQYIGKILPLTYTGDALTQIIMYGKGLTSLGTDILALLIFLLILLWLNIIGLKRYRKV